MHANATTRTSRRLLVTHATAAIAAGLALSLAGPALAQTSFSQYDGPSSNNGGYSASFGDYNNDGHPDLLTIEGVFRNGDDPTTSGKSRYLRNLDFDNKGNRLAPSNGGVWGDYNGDGRQDFFSYFKQELYRNDGNDTFTKFEQGQGPLPTLDMDNSNGASWADFDNDSDLDLYVGGYETDNGYQPDVRLENQNGNFTKTFVESGNVDPARGITTADYDRDGDADIYVSNYRLRGNDFYQNDGHGNFNEVAAAKGVKGTSTPGGTGGLGEINTYGHTIGSAFGDLDNDGLQDLVVGNFAHAPDFQDRPKFYKNLGESDDFSFELKKTLDGDEYQESYASPALADYDNDGDLDVFLTTTYLNSSNRAPNPGTPNDPVLFRNDGDFTFTKVNSQAGLDNLNTSASEADGQAAWADFDNDGDLDLVTSENLFLNNASENGNHWLQVTLEGDGENVNLDAIGAQVTIDLDDQTLLREVTAGTGQGNQNQQRLHFGLGDLDQDTVDLEVLWPGGETQTVEGVRVDQFTTVAIPEPGTVFLLGLGGMTLLSGRRSRRVA